MNKGIMKEIIIILLLTLIILLVLGILLYGFVPNNKTIPEQVSYVTPENIKEQINSEKINEDQVILTHEIDATELQNYKKVKDYKPGKPNPFSSTTTSTTTGTNTQTNNSGTSSNNTTQSNTQSSNTVTNNINSNNTANKNNNGTQENTTTYYPNKGIK